MSKPEFLYVAIIAAPREKVWAALTSAEFTQLYWYATRIRSDFAVGSKIQFIENDGGVGCEGEILEARAPTRLSYTWRFPRNPLTRDEPPSRVTFDLEDAPGGTKLTVRHDRFEASARTYELVSNGWPYVISGLSRCWKRAPSRRLRACQTHIDFNPREAMLASGGCPRSCRPTRL